jgi:hypothetical protein
MMIQYSAYKPILAALLKLDSVASYSLGVIAAIECIACDCAVAQEAFDSREVYDTLFSTVSQSSCTACHAEVCRAMTALLRGRGLSSSAWGDVDALSDCIRAIGNAADASSCDAAAEFVDALAAEMSQSVAEALLARGDVPGAVERMAGAASSHWCRVVLLSGVYRLILLAAGFRSSLCSDAVVQAAHAAMMNVEDDYDCGTVANAVGELLRGHGKNKAAFSCEATCKGLMRMAEAAVEQVTVQVVPFKVLPICDTHLVTLSHPRTSHSQYPAYTTETSTLPVPRPPLPRFSLCESTAAHLSHAVLKRPFCCPISG